MSLPVLARARLALRQMWDAWAGPGGASTSILAWDAAKAGRLSRWVPPSSNFATGLQPAMLKARARDAYRNISHARRAVDLLGAYTIGTGITPLVGVEDPALRRRVHALWTRWTDSADYCGIFDFYGLQAQAFKAALIDGESITVIKPGPTLQLQVLSSEFLDVSRDNNQNIANGIEYNAAGERVAYWLYAKHPAQALNPVSVRVPAANVIHLFAPLQPGFQRGVSWLAPALTNLYELLTFNESHLVRAKTAALFCGFVRTPDGADIMGANQQDSAPAFEPGGFIRLRSADEVSFTNPPTVEAAYDPFVKSQLRSISASLNVPYELLSGDLGSVTFASGRHGLLAFKRTVEQIANNVVVYQFCRPIFSWWTRIMAASGQLPAEIVDAPVRWIQPPVEMLDSRMEVQSTIAKIRAGLLPLSEAIAQTGWDSEIVLESIARDNALIDKLNLTLDSDPRKTTVQGQQQPEVTAAP